jgi:hypothetical protein
VKILSWLFTVLLVISLICTFVYFGLPGWSQKVVEFLSVDEWPWELILLAADVVVAAFSIHYTHLYQEAERQICLYQFNITDDSLRFDEYISFDNTDKLSYTYEYRRENNDIETPFHVIKIRFSRQPHASVNIPFVLTLLSCPAGNSLHIRDVAVDIIKGGKVIRKFKAKKLNHEISHPIQQGMKFLIRFSMLCQPKLEEALSESRCIISMLLVLHDCHGINHKKYIMVEVQNALEQQVIMGVTTAQSKMEYLIKQIKKRTI